MPQSLYFVLLALLFTQLGAITGSSLQEEPDDTPNPIEKLLNSNCSKEVATTCNIDLAAIDLTDGDEVQDVIDCITEKLPDAEECQTKVKTLTCFTNTCFYQMVHDCTTRGNEDLVACILMHTCVRDYKFGDIQDCFQPIKDAFPPTPTPSPSYLPSATVSVAASSTLSSTISSPPASPSPASPSPAPPSPGAPSPSVAISPVPAASGFLPPSPSTPPPNAGQPFKMDSMTILDGLLPVDPSVGCVNFIETTCTNTPPTWKNETSTAAIYSDALNSTLSCISDNEAKIPKPCHGAAYRWSECQKSILSKCSTEYDSGDHSALKKCVEKNNKEMNGCPAQGLSNLAIIAISCVGGAVVIGGLITIGWIFLKRKRAEASGYSVVKDYGL